MGPLGERFRVQRLTTGNLMVNMGKVKVNFFSADSCRPARSSELNRRVYF